MKRKRITALMLGAAAIATLVWQVAIAGAHSTHARRDGQPTHSRRATDATNNRSGTHATFDRKASDPGGAQTTTPIKHLVVLFQENVSFDHYFATYPNATNPAGEPAFRAAPGTPSVNGLSGALLTNNPNEYNPQRLGPAQAVTCDQDHSYTAEQKAFDMGAMDKFVQNTGTPTCTTKGAFMSPGLVMDYYDGNTVTGLWNYAQNFALSDNSFGTTFGPSTPGAINVTAGNTYGALCGPSSATYPGTNPCTDAPGSVAATPGSPNGQGTETVNSDSDPNYDICSSTEDKDSAASTIQMGGENIGDLLDAAHITWGWFEGGFASPGYVPGDPSSDNLSEVCTGTHDNIAGASSNDYIPHHEPFQYYQSTANPLHKPPTSIAMIGHQDQANHQYDIKDFWAAADSGNLPAVSYIKAPAYEDGHAGYSDPLDEQRYLAETINRLEKLPTWKSTAIVINYDDSDGWYDHQMGPTITQSQTIDDALTGTGMCGSGAPPAGQQSRCGVGPRLPLLVISPYSKVNYVDNTFTEQTSVVRFIEDNWLGGQRIPGGSADALSGTLDNMFDFSRPNAHPLFLNPQTGERQSGR